MTIPHTLQFSGLGFVTLGPFHCAYIYLCLSVCILCVFVSYCIVVINCEHSGVDLMELKSNP